jgi:hypothetical protein
LLLSPGSDEPVPGDQVRNLAEVERQAVAFRDRSRDRRFRPPAIGCDGRGKVDEVVLEPGWIDDLRSFAPVT